jgi:hypothetical protein
METWTIFETQIRNGLNRYMANFSCKLTELLPLNVDRSSSLGQLLLPLRVGKIEHMPCLEAGIGMMSTNRTLHNITEYHIHNS